MEILPELLISRDCPRLIDAIPKCIHSEENPDTIDDRHFPGKDEIDSCIYLLSGIRDEKPTKMPKEMDRIRQLDEVRRRNPELTTADMIWIARGIEQRQAEAEAELDGFCMGRSARRSRFRDTVQ